MRDQQKVLQLGMLVLIFLSLLFIGKSLWVYRVRWTGVLRNQLESRIMDSQTPALGYVGIWQNRDNNARDAKKQLAEKVFPIYQYVSGYPKTAMNREDRELMHQIILSEGRDEDNGEKMTAGKEEQAGKTKEEKDVPEKEVDRETPKKTEKGGEEEHAAGDEESFTYNTGKACEVDLASLSDFETLLSKYYSLDSSTTIDETQLNVDKLMSYDMHLEKSGDEPQILIYHTHSQEAFVDSDPADPATTIVGAGEKLAGLLRGYGFSVLHHTGQYDVESRDYAYSRAAPAVEKILEENPSIEVIIDLHRDGVAEGTHIVTQINGKQMAQFMFFNGLSRTKARGDIAYLPNDHIAENLAFSFQAQLVANEYYPGLARKIYLKGYRYNMHYRGKSLLIELGAQTNTVEEIMNAIDPLAHILKITLTGEE